MKVTAKKALLIGLASSTLFGMAGCTIGNNIQGDVYGAPMYEENNDVENAEETIEGEDGIEGEGN